MAMIDGCTCKDKRLCVRKDRQTDRQTDGPRWLSSPHLDRQVLGVPGGRRAHRGGALSESVRDGCSGPHDPAPSNKQHLVTKIDVARIEGRATLELSLIHI